MNENTIKSDRRQFLETVASGTIAGLSINVPFIRKETAPENEEEWFAQLNGKHRIVFDCVSPNEGLSIVWSYNFLEANNRAGFADKDLSVLIVLRNKAISLAFQDSIWKKYKFGKFYKVMDYSTNAAADYNLFYDPPAGAMPEQGMSIKKLQERGVLICVCESAIKANLKHFATGSNADDVKKEWLSGILPKIQVMSAGVLAINRAQEHGASYCYAG